MSDDKSVAFTKWQAAECARLGLSVEEHDKMVEIAERLAIAAPMRDTYGDLAWLIMDSQLPKLGEVSISVPPTL